MAFQISGVGVVRRASQGVTAGSLIRVTIHRHQRLHKNKRTLMYSVACMLLFTVAWYSMIITWSDQVYLKQSHYYTLVSGLGIESNLHVNSLKSCFCFFLIILIIICFLSRRSSHREPSGFGRGSQRGAGPLRKNADWIGSIYGA